MESPRYPLDSHVLLCWWFEPERLSEPMQTLLADPSTKVLVSAATVGELSLKHHQGIWPELAHAVDDIPTSGSTKTGRLQRSLP